MGLTPSNNVERLNDLLNHPEIYQWVCGDFDGPLQFSNLPWPWILLEYEHGAFWFIEERPGEWDAHTLIPPGSPNTVGYAVEAISFIRSVPGYKKILGRCPRTNPRAARLLEKLGFTYAYTHGVYQGEPLDHYEKL